MNQIVATLCQTRTRTPLASIALPGDGANMTPHQLRALADVLVRIAADCEAQPMDVRHYARKLRSYRVAT